MKKDNDNFEKDATKLGNGTGNGNKITIMQYKTNSKLIFPLIKTNINIPLNLSIEVDFENTNIINQYMHNITEKIRNIFRWNLNMPSWKDYTGGFISK